jgi:DNA-binding NtrC family response regulator
LGLSTVHGIVNQSGGTVLVESEVGMGTTFSIYLPRISGSAADSQGEEASVAAGHLHGTILIAEDEEAVGALAERVLAAHGHRVFLTSNAAQALSTLSAEPGIDLLITDMVLPGGMQGGELADAARSIRKDLAVLYMSGYSQDSSIHGGRLDEGVSFLQKPFTSSELINKVEDTLAGRSRPARPRSQNRRRKDA